MHDSIYAFSMHIVQKSMEHAYILKLAFLQALDTATEYINCLEGHNPVRVMNLILTLLKEKADEAKVLVFFPLSAYQCMVGS